jgi:hypothetical protein
VEKLEGFHLIDKKTYVFRLNKSLYGINQYLRYCYYRLDKYLHQQGFEKGKANINLYIKAEYNDMLIVFVYVDDINFGSNIELMSKMFAVEM